MARALILVALLAACRSPPPPPETRPPRFAILMPQGIEIQDDTTRIAVPRTDDVETFCWTSDGAGFYATNDDALIHVSVAGKRRVLTEGWHAIRFPAVSPDGNRIAFSGRQRTGEPWGVWVISTRPDSRPRRTVDGYGPAWEADGTRLYFERFRPNRGLSMVDMSNGETHPFLDDGRSAHTVTCSRSGGLIIFTRGRALTLFKRASSSVHELTSQRAYNRFPSISPGERYIIYFRQDPTGETHPERALVILDLETLEEQVLDVPAELAKFAP